MFSLSKLTIITTDFMTHFI